MVRQKRAGGGRCDLLRRQQEALGRPSREGRTRTEVAAKLKELHSTRLLKVHVLPVLGPKNLLDIRPDDVELALDKMAVKGRSASTMRPALNLTRRVLKFAECRGLAVRNAASLVETPEGPTATRAGLTPEEAAHAGTPPCSRQRLS